VATVAWGLALSGGGLLGAAHLGVLRALGEWGLRPGALAGASAGGLVAGVIAAGGSLPALTAYGRQVAAHPLDHFRPRALRLLAELLPHDPFGPADSLFDPGPFLDGLTALCPEPHRIEAWRLPTALTAVDFGRMQAVAFVRAPAGGLVPPGDGWRVVAAGDLRIALQATMAMPGVFAPVRLDGEFLVDGGVADNLPQDWAVAAGAQRVLAVDVAGLRSGLPPRAGILWSLGRTEAFFTHALSALRAPRVPILRLEPATAASAGWSPADYEALVEAGYAAAVARRGEIETFVGGG
jgi:NTE family protein